MEKISYLKLEDRDIISLEKNSLFIEHLDYFIGVFTNTCKYTQRKGDVLVEYKCPLFYNCDRKQCKIADELRLLAKWVEK